MARVVVYCQKCGNPVSASKWSKHAKCSCGATVDIKQALQEAAECPYCGTITSCRKGKNKVRCAGCNREFAPIDSLGDALKRKMNITCPKCNANVDVKLVGSNKIAVCPICHCEIDVEKVVAIDRQHQPNSVSVIRYEMSPDVLVYRYPIEKINSGSQLVVAPAQQALLVSGGKPLNLYESGTYTISTESVPFLASMNKPMTGEQTPFFIQVYYFSTSKFMGIQWGIGGITYRDANIGDMPFSIGLSGTLDIRITNPRKLLLEIVGEEAEIGTKDLFTPTLEQIEKYGIDLEKRPPKKLLLKKMEPIIKASLSTIIMENRMDVFNMQPHLVGLANILGNNISRQFETFGLTLEDFTVSHIQLPENDPNFIRVRELMEERLAAKINIQSIGIEDAVKQAEHEGRENEIRRNTAERVAEVSGDKMVETIGNMGDLSNLREAQMVGLEIKQASGIVDADINAYGLMGEAQAMNAMGYTGKDVLDSQVAIANAEALGKVGSRVGGGGFGGGGFGGGGFGGGLGGTFADIAIGTTIGSTLGNAVSSRIEETMNGKQNNVNSNKSAAKSMEVGGDSWVCPKCKKEVATLFCGTCGEKKPVKWTCTKCGAENTTAFCGTCGEKKPEKWTCQCGASNEGAFCGSCGQKKPTGEESKE